MRVSVVDVRVMGMRMDKWPVFMRMAVRLRPLPALVPMLMMLVVDVAVLVLHWLVPVCMLMPLDKVQIQPQAHKRGRCQELHRHRLAEHRDRHHGPSERREREVRSGPRRAQVAQRQHE